METSQVAGELLQQKPTCQCGMYGEFLVKKGDGMYVAAARQRWSASWRINMSAPTLFLVLY